MSATGPQAGREICTPCGGKGTVISALGGERHDETCPWCGGSGRFRAGLDAQDPQAERAG